MDSSHYILIALAAAFFAIAIFQQLVIRSSVRLCRELLADNERLRSDDSEDIDRGYS